jgi:hypothetical protein
VPGLTKKIKTEKKRKNKTYLKKTARMTFSQNVMTSNYMLLVVVVEEGGGGRCRALTRQRSQRDEAVLDGEKKTQSPLGIGEEIMERARSTECGWTEMRWRP